MRHSTNKRLNIATSLHHAPAHSHTSIPLPNINALTESKEKKIVYTTVEAKIESKDSKDLKLDLKSAGDDLKKDSVSINTKSPTKTPRVAKEFEKYAQSTSEIHNPIYVGIAIDMDRAYNGTRNTNGQYITPSHNKKSEYEGHEKKFRDNMTEIFSLITENKMSSGITWFVNEPAYKITVNYPDILTICQQFPGEFGLHTHFNSSQFGASCYTMSSDPNNWLERGLNLPKKQLESFLNNNISIFKSGNHVRNKAMFDEIIRLGFNVDSTKVYEDKVIDNGHLMFDDSKIKFGNPPMFIYNTAKTGRVLEFPEIRCSVNNILAHIRGVNERDPEEPIFIRLQTHPWQSNLLKVYASHFNALTACFPQVNYATLESMANIYYDFLNTKNNKLLIKKSISLLSDANNIRDYNLEGYYANRIRSGTMIDQNDQQAIQIITRKIPINTKILELFAGCGQSSLALARLEYLNVNILEIDKGRCKLTDYLKKKLNVTINVINEDFFIHDINQYDFIFAVNAVASCLDNKLDAQYDKYISFMENKNHQMLLNMNLYSTDNKYTVINKIINNIDAKVLNFRYCIYPGNFVLFSHSQEQREVTRVNAIIQNYKILKRDNHSILLSTFNDVSICAKVTYLTPEKTNGIFFEFTHQFYKARNFVLPKRKYRLSFQAKVDNSCINTNVNLRVYTGEKYVESKIILTNTYQSIIFDEEFNFNTRSSYRINVAEPFAGLVYYIKDPMFMELDNKEVSDSKESREVKEIKELKEVKEIKEIKENKEIKEIKESQETVNNKVIQSLWIGESLSTMERLCIQSFLKNGHQFHLYVYNEVKNVPIGTTIKNGEDILPRSKIFKYYQPDGNGSVSSFSNLFRYKLLYEKGGYWVDMDMICCKPFDFKEEYVFSSECPQDGKEQVINCGVIKVPPKTELMNYLHSMADQKDTSHMLWGETGPKLFSQGVIKYHLEKYVLPAVVFCPVYYTQLSVLINIEKYEIPKDSYAIHLWNECWRRLKLDKNKTYCLTSVYEKLKTQYL